MNIIIWKRVALVKGDVYFSLVIQDNHKNKQIYLYIGEKLTSFVNEYKEQPESTF